ncbi:MAG: pitrilysin family protein [Eubacteriales bacterium]|nr:pitrilysin family protein [Eubacteriales bacterium]MDD4327365.1 pitrilysin family protein [Eubacteriales bacterium]MDD4717097.1 pitrilysin family protein [Eubacteriales bacterium]
MQDSGVVQTCGFFHSNREDTEKSDKTTGLRLLKTRHESGLRVNILPKSGFTKKFAGIYIPFGSVNTVVRYNGRSVRLPAGTAHYMEHCVFSKDEGGGLLSRLSAMGANANAFTSFDSTMYYFSSSENFREILDVYARAVMSPYLGQDRIESEREIIIQELGMYKDNADNSAFNELTANMYSRHPVRYDIGGTPDSVRRIRPVHLEAVKCTCYFPPSAVLTICGDVDLADVPDLSEYSVQNKTIDETAVNDLHFGTVNEPLSVLKRESRMYMDVAVGSFLLGFKNQQTAKLDAMTRSEFLRYKKRSELLLDTLLGEASDAFEYLFKRGLINDSFGVSAVYLNGASFIMIGGESNDPESACYEVRKILNEKLIEGPDDRSRNDFDLKVKMSTGDFVRSLDHVDSLGMMQSRMSVYDLDVFEYFGIYDNMDIDEAFNDLRSAVSDEASSEVYVFRKKR